MADNDSVLLRFLNSGLIPLGGDDTKFEKLKNTAADLVVSLRKSPAKAIPYSLIAFDPDAPPGDPVIQEVTKALTRRWATHVNTFSGTPVGVFRGMLLDALFEAAKGDDGIALSFVNCARNVLPFMEIGAERAIWADVLTALELDVDRKAEEQWSVPSQIRVAELKPVLKSVTPPAISSSKVDRDQLQRLVEAAGGPSNAAGQGTGGNRYWPGVQGPYNNQQQAMNWVHDFAIHMTRAIAETVDSAVSSVKSPPIDFSTPLQQLGTAVAVHVEAAMAAVGTATAGLQRRTMLIWWKESLFSPSARVSYRELSGPVAAALMAFDLCQQVPVLSPASVAAFLRETVSALLLAEMTQKLPICDLIEELLVDSAADQLKREAARLTDAARGRGLLISLIGRGEKASSLTHQTFRDLVGVPPDTVLTLPEWAIWLFREFQAARATNGAAAMEQVQTA